VKAGNVCGAGAGPLGGAGVMEMGNETHSEAAGFASSTATAFGAGVVVVVASERRVPATESSSSLRHGKKPLSEKIKCVQPTVSNTVSTREATVLENWFISCWQSQSAHTQGKFIFFERQ